MNYKIEELFQRVKARGQTGIEMLSAQMNQPSEPSGKASNVAACKAGREIAERARAYQQECAAIGLHVTAAGAVSHVLKEGGGK